MIKEKITLGPWKSFGLWKNGSNRTVQCWVNLRINEVGCDFALYCAGNQFGLIHQGFHREYAIEQLNGMSHSRVFRGAVDVRPGGMLCVGVNNSQGPVEVEIEVLPR